MAIIIDQTKVTQLKDEEAVKACSPDDKRTKLLFDINFDQENRLRVLEGKPPITKSQYKTALINQYKSLP